MKHFGLALLASAMLFASCSDAPHNTITAPDAPQSVKKGASRIDLTDRYIVVLKSDVADVDEFAARVTRQFGGTVHARYHHVLKGFAATLPAQALEGISHNPNIDFIEADQLVTADAVQAPVPSWGLDRVDQRTLPLSASYQYVSTGERVTAYIIDTGILTTHQEFGGRAESGYDFVDGDADATDGNGHGTHVAGTVGGATYGIAKGVHLVAVRVLDNNGSGSYSGVISGIDWVAQNHATLRTPAVANMSLGGGYSLAVNNAVTSAINAGVTFCVAAGNNGLNAANYSPASTAAAITVGATTNTDARASYSNYGSVLDVFAPGTGITSSWIGSTTATNTISGTSMATPHVTGIAALYLAANSSATPAQVASAIVTNATPGVLSGIGSGSPNKLAYSIFAPSVTVHVSGFTGTSVLAGSKWKGQVTVSAADPNGTGVSGVTVTMTWTGSGTSGTATATTGTNGLCTLSTGSINRTTTTVTMTVTNLSGTGFTYNKVANIAPYTGINPSVAVTKP